MKKFNSSQVVIDIQNKDIDSFAYDVKDAIDSLLKDLSGTQLYQLNSEIDITEDYKPDKLYIKLLVFEDFKQGDDDIAFTDEEAERWCLEWRENELHKQMRKDKENGNSNET